MFSPEFQRKRMQFMATQKEYKTKYGPILAAKPLVLAAGGGTEAEGGDEEIKKYYAFNQAGNVMVSSTVLEQKDIQPAVKEVFAKASVLLLMITAAMQQKKKSLYDYEAWHDIIAGSGNFLAMHEEDRTFSYSSKELTLDTAIITAALGSVSPMGGALKVAQRVIESMGSQIRLFSSTTQATKKIAHMLLVCEDLMGMPLVSVSLFCVDSKEAQSVSQSNCHSYVSATVNFKYHQEVFMFVDPDYISKYAMEFKQDAEQQKLINEFASLIKEH